MAISQINSTVSSINPYGVGEYNPVASGNTPGMMTANSLPQVNVTAPNPAGSTNGTGGGVDFAGLDSALGTPTMQGVGTPNISAPNTGLDSSGGFDWTDLLSGVGNILSSPAGSALTLAGLGEYEAGQASKDTAKLTSQLTGPAQPFVNLGVTEAKQTMQGLTGRPMSSGSIGQQETTAANLGNVAEQYSTGKLTAAQTAKIQQDTAAQKQNIRQQLQSQGISDGSVLAMYDQQIDANAQQQTEALTQQNLQISQQALSSVQQTYSNLLNQSIASFGAGMGPIEDAVNLTIQQNTQIAAGLQSLFGQIARGFSSASQGGSGSGSGGGGLSKGVGQVLNAGKSLLGSGINTGSLSQGGLDATTGSEFGDISSSTGALESGVAGDVAASNDAWLGGLGDIGNFSSAGGGAAGSATAFGTDAGIAPATTLTGELPGTQAISSGFYGSGAAGGAGPAGGTTSLSTGGSAAAGAAGGAASAAGGAGSALGAGAPGTFATGNAAAGSAGAASGASGAVAAVAPLAFAAIAGIAISDALSAEATNSAGNKAMKEWMTATGTTFKPAPSQSNSGQNTFGTVNANGLTMGGGPSNGKAAATTSPGTFVGKDGKPMTPAQAEKAIVAWAKKNGIPTGNLS